jgi:anoctamin-10
MLSCVRGYNSDITDLQDGSKQKFMIVKLLLDKGATLRIYAKENINNPLHWACYFGDIFTTKLLLDKMPHLSNFIIISHHQVLLKNDLSLFPIDHTLMT